MMLSEVTAVPGAALPVAELAAHLRLGSGFAMAPDQDALLESHLRAAMAAIEGRIAKALLARRFRLLLDGWRDAASQPLPVAPVGSVVGVTLLPAAGDPVEVAPGLWRLVPDLHRPRLEPARTALPVVPQGWQVAIEFDAGFGPAWGDVPPDLRQAVLLLAAEFHEHRHGDGTVRAALPAAVAGLIERWRLVRVLGGRGR